MALYYFNITPVTKDKQSIVAKSSYTSGESLYSERDLETKSYKKREVEPETFILAPKHAPEWVYNREQLWNEVEKIERSYNSRLAKEIKVALPIELSNEQQTKMLLDYVKENIVSRGIVADISIHRDKEENPHAHILITTRPFDEKGNWGNKKKREYVYDQDGNPILDKNGKKKFETVQLTDWDKNETLLEWRKNFAEKINEYYRLNSVNEKVSHESYENQGLDQLPKQRLSREEYAIEQRAKEQARMEGKEYKPVTTYGKLNQEIENTNKKLEIINQKIVSLSEYKKHVENEQRTKLDSIRKNYNFSEQDWKSLKVVSKRISGFVDVNNAKDNLDKLNNWKKKIDYVGRLLKAEEKVLVKAKITHDKEASKTLLYGFIPNKFEQQFSESLTAFKTKLEAHNKSLEAFNEIYEHSLRAYEIQKEFTNEEFKYLYPQYDHVQSNDPSIIEMKFKYVEDFKNEVKVRNSIPEFEQNLHKLSNDYLRLEHVLNDWKETKNSLLILERTKEKRKEDIKQHYQNYDGKKLYQSQIIFTDFRNQIEEKEGHLDRIKNVLNHEMNSRYPEVTVETIREIPAEIQAKVLTLHLNNEHTGKLSEDLKTVQEIELHKQKDKNREQSELSEGEINGKDSGALFNALIGMAQSQETKDDDLERQRKLKKKQNKLYREMGEQEL
jgi:uncharacterized protein YfkK (UPF0435 family)